MPSQARPSISTMAPDGPAKTPVGHTSVCRFSAPYLSLISGFYKRPSTTPCFRRRFLSPHSTLISPLFHVCLLYVVLQWILMCIYSVVVAGQGSPNLADSTLVVGNAQPLIQGSGRIYFSVVNIFGLMFGCGAAFTAAVPNTNTNVNLQLPVPGSCY